MSLLMQREDLHEVLRAAKSREPRWSLDELLNFEFDVEHPKIGPMKNIGYPVKFSRTPQQYRSPAPWLGQHTEEVLSELGYGREQIDSLFGDAVVFDKYRAAGEPR